MKNVTVSIFIFLSFFIKIQTLLIFDFVFFSRPHQSPTSIIHILIDVRKKEKKNENKLDIISKQYDFVG